MEYIGVVIMTSPPRGCSHPVQVAWLGEGERHLSLLDDQVARGIRHVLHKLRQVSLVRPQLQAVHLDDVRADVIQEALVMADLTAW